MNCEQLGNIGFTCEAVAQNVLFVQTPLALAFDGQSIGFYVQEMPNGELRLSDNADTLFTATSHGISLDRKIKTLDNMATAAGVTLSDAGELCTICSAETLTYHAGRMIEATDRIGMWLAGQKPTPTSNFDKYVFSILQPVFGKKLKRDHEVTGASGHQLKFPFFLALDNPKYIATVSCDDNGKPHWASVYQTVGKMLDIKNAGHTGRRIVIMENGDPNSIAQAETVLAEASSIQVLMQPERLIELLAA